MTSFNLNSLNDEQRFALFYGIMLGDGCLSQYNTKDGRERFVISITGHAIDDKLFYDNILTGLLKSFGRTSVSVKIRKDCNALEINFPDKDLFNKIHFYGFPIGKKGPNISIPKYFFDNNLSKYVVAGFMATDGSLVLTKNPNKYYPRIEGNGISKKLIKQIFNYLSSAGMEGAFYLAKRKAPNSVYNVQQQYRFQFNGRENLLLFKEQIGFVNFKHQNKFHQFLEYCEKYEKAIANIPSRQQKHFRINHLNGSPGIQTPNPGLSQN